MPWYVNTLESFAVTHVRPAPPERVDVRRAAAADRDKTGRAEPASERNRTR